MLRIRLSYWPLLMLVLWSCRKDVERFQPYSPTADELGTILAEQIPGVTTHSTFTLNNLTTDKILETPNGARVFLIDTDHLFADAASGQTVLCSTCPDLKVEVTEVLDKGDIIARGLNTVSVTGMLFESEGMVKISATCNGQALALLPNRTLKIQVPENNPDNGYFVFNQVADGIADRQWENSGQEVFKAEWPLPNGTQLGYEILANDLGWVACGRQITDPSSSFCLSLPAGFADQNTLGLCGF